MRICILGSANSIHTQRWVKSLNDFGHEVMVISLYDGKVENAINVILPRTKKIYYLKHYFAVKKAIKSFSPDILHAHHASSYGFLGSLLRFKPFIVSVWGYDVLLFPYKSLLHKLIIKTSLERADLITATSQTLSDAVKKLTDLPSEIIPFGVDKHFFWNDREYNKQNLVIGITKDLRPVYGIDVLIKSFAKLIAKKYTLKLVIVGDGPLKNQLVKLCQQLDIEKHVIFKNRVPHSKIIDLLMEIDIFAIPSYSEGFGVAAIEAMASGIPVVGSNVGGLREVIDDGKTGILVKPGDVDDLKMALEYYIINTDARTKHGRAGRKKVEEKYNWQDNAVMMNKLYLKIVNGKD